MHNVTIHVMFHLTYAAREGRNETARTDSATRLGSVPSLNGFVNGILIVSCCFGKMKTEEKKKKKNGVALARGWKVDSLYVNAMRLSITPLLSDGVMFLLCLHPA